MRKDKVVTEVLGQAEVITPSDLYSRKFKRTAFGGYDPRSVDPFMERLADVLEDLSIQVRMLTEKCEEQRLRLEEYRQMESTLRNALISSQTLGEEVLDAARREAAVLVEEAKLIKERAMFDAAKIPESLARDIQRIEQQHRVFRADFLALLEAHRELLEDGSVSAQSGSACCEFEPVPTRTIEDTAILTTTEDSSKTGEDQV